MNLCEILAVNRASPSSEEYAAAKCALVRLNDDARFEGDFEEWAAAAVDAASLVRRQRRFSWIRKMFGVRKEKPHNEAE